MDMTPHTDANSTHADLNQIQDILFGRQMRSYEQVLKAQASTIDSLNHQVTRLQESLEQEKVARTDAMQLAAQAQLRMQTGLTGLETQANAAHKHLEATFSGQLASLAKEHEQWKTSVSHNNVTRQQLETMFRSMADSLKHAAT